jgi:hypothetical protein
MLKLDDGQYAGSNKEGSENYDKIFSQMQPSRIEDYESFPNTLNNQFYEAPFNQMYINAQAVNYSQNNGNTYEANNFLNTRQQQPKYILHFNNMPVSSKTFLVKQYDRNDFADDE